MKKIKLSIAGLLLTGMSYGQINEVHYAKKIILNNVGNVTTDSPYSVDSLFDESQEMMIFAHKLLKKYTSMTVSELEDALGCNGYEKALKFAYSPTCYIIDDCRVKIVPCNTVLQQYEIRIECENCDEID